MIHELTRMAPLAILITGVLLLYIGAPIMLHAARGADRHQAFAVVPVYRTPGAARRFLDDACQALAELSFRDEARIRTSSGNGNAIGYVAVLRNARGDRATVAIVFSQTIGKQRMVIHAVEFLSDLSEGRTVSTSNSSVPTLAPRQRNLMRTACQTADASLLYAVHQYQMRRAFGDSPAYDELTAKMGPVEYLQADHVRSHDNLVKGGMEYYDATRATYRYTWIGAFRAVWMMLWPLKAWNARKRRRDEAQLLANVQSASADVAL
jgi:hypothetical protein